MINLGREIMSYSSYLKPRKETISDDGIEGIIDLANLTSGNTGNIEANPELFFSLTYPTSDLLRVIEEINNRFGTERDTSGLFLFEGLKGSGKSHLLLVYNLFKFPELAQNWLKQNNIECKIPGDITVVINKFTDNPYECLWQLPFNALGKEVEKGKTHPKLDEFERALGDKKIVLLFDELEQGIKVIADPALQAQNIAFLQMISEFSNRSKQVTLFTSIYSDRAEPGETLKRVNPRCTVQFDNSQDKCNVILHRIFENYLTFDSSRIIPVIESYVHLWRKHTSLDEESTKSKFQETYPFSPSLMDVVLNKIPSRGGFQNVRGALSFLGNMVKMTHEINDIITPADASLDDKATLIMLRDLDIGGDLINRARENMEELKPKAPISNKFASNVFLYTVTGFESAKGVTRDSLVTDLLSPTVDINELNHSVINFQKYASYFHTQADRYFFDIEEQPEARVELRSLQYGDDHAIDLISDIMKTEVFRDSSSSVIFSNIEQTQQLLNQLDKSRLRYVLAGRRLAQEERHNIYFGMDMRNLVILLETRDDKFQLFSDKDVLKWAKRVIAAQKLAEGSIKTTQKTEYESIARADQSYIIDRIKKAGMVFVSWEEYGTDVNDDRVELEPIPGDCSKDKTLEALNQNYFPMLTFKEHLEERIEYNKDKLVKEIVEEYKKTPGFPVPVIIGVLLKAIRELCKEGSIGIQHSRGNYCRRNPDLTETEFINAKIIDPFEEQPSICPLCGKSPCICSPKQPVLCPNCGRTPCECAPEPLITCPNCGQEPCICPQKETISLGVPPQTSIGSLRENVAFKLQEYDEAEIIKANYKIFFQRNNIGDLSTLPASLRGNLSGQGDVIVEISITKSGRFSKSQIEQQVESLPSIHDADYSVDLIIEISK